MMTENGRHKYSDKEQDLKDEDNSEFHFTFDLKIKWQSKRSSPTTASYVKQQSVVISGVGGSFWDFKFQLNIIQTEVCFKCVLIFAEIIQNDLLKITVHFCILYVKFFFNLILYCNYKLSSSNHFAVPRLRDVVLVFFKLILLFLGCFNIQVTDMNFCLDQI